MNRQNEKRICWNCNGEVSHEINHCPFCGVNVDNPAPPSGRAPYRREELGSPFQKAPQSTDEDPFHFHPRPSPLNDAAVAVSDQEWKDSLEEEDEVEEILPTGKREIVALVLLLPGVVFLLFGLLLLFFSKEGMLTLHWKQSLAFFYFLASLPLMFLGWRALK